MGNYYLYQLGRFFIRILPLKISYFLADLLAGWHFSKSHADRQAVLANLAAITNQKSVDPSMARDVFRNFSRYLVDFFIMHRRVNKDFIARYVTIENIEVINRVLAGGKGGIIVSAHLGNWEMGGAILPMLGYPLSVVALPHKDPRVNAFFNNQRERFGSTVIPSTVAVRRCIEHLKANRFVAILADRDFTQHGIKMPFLNKHAMIPRGAAIFSLKTQAPIIPSFFLRDDHGQYVVKFEEAIYPPVINGTISDQDIEQLMKRYLEVIERYIKQYPTQWLLFREYAV